MDQPPTINFEVKDPAAAKTTFSKIEIRRALTDAGPLDCFSGELIGTFLTEDSNLQVNQVGMETTFKELIFELYSQIQNSGLDVKVATYRFCYFDPAGAVSSFEVPTSLKSETLKVQ